MKQGFTLIEVLAAALIITLGAGGAFALVQRTVNFTANAGFQLEASYLAQEGMEIVRNIRDANLLKVHKGVQGAAWDDNLTSCSAGCQADYTQNTLGAYQDTFLQFSSGFYSHTPSADSLYKRKITITQPSADVLLVSVEVIWTEKNRSHTVTAASELYNWLPVPPAP